MNKFCYSIDNAMKAYNIQRQIAYYSNVYTYDKVRIGVSLMR